MANVESLEMKGKLTIQKFNSLGELVETVKANNKIVTSGRDLVAKLFLGEGIPKVQFVAVGTGEGNTEDNTTTLMNEVYRVLITEISEINKKLTIKDNRAYVTIKAELPESLDGVNENLALTEAGLFNSDNGGVMYNRVTFPVITKTDKFSLTLVWEIVF